MMSKVCTLVLLLLCVSAPLKAQSDAQDIIQPEKPALHNGLTSFTLDFLNDQKAIWTSPLHRLVRRWVRYSFLTIGSAMR